MGACLVLKNQGSSSVSLSETTLPHLYPSCWGGDSCREAEDRKQGPVGASP